MRVNSKDVGAPVRDFDLTRTVFFGHWCFHPNVIDTTQEVARAYGAQWQIDVAVLAINWDVMKEQKIEPAFFANDTTVANRAKLRDREVAAGDSVFGLGFLMGLTGAQRNYIIVRQGCIARISEMLSGLREWIFAR